MNDETPVGGIGVEDRLAAILSEFDVGPDIDAPRVRFDVGYRHGHDADRDDEPEG
ncbi:MAG TPA: hypothetical protein VIW24_20425 [Aldersonia sp.]